MASKSCVLRIRPKQCSTSPPGASPVEKDSEGVELPKIIPVPVPARPIEHSDVNLNGKGK